LTTMLLLKLAITSWLVTVALWDLRTTRIPNQLTFPAMAATGGLRFCLGLWGLGLLLLRVANGGDLACYGCLTANMQGIGNLLFTLVAWAIIFGGWKLNIIGGGDAKLLMALFALFPTYNFTLIFGLVTLAALLPLLVLQYWGKRPLDALWKMVFRLRTGLFPTREELERKGKQYAWVFCLPGVIYLWLLW
jgi:Flp pilus assembly protein protease CpaA